jgi:hypothetical protein
MAGLMDDILDTALDKAVRDASDKLKSLAIQEAPVDKGLLASSHIVERVGKAHYRIGPDADKLERSAGVDYSPFVFYGTKPHVIRIKNKSVLTNGQEFFGTRVNHPGTKANRWLERALGRLTI